MLWDLMRQFDWWSIVAEIAREAVGVIVGIAVSWFVLFRKRLKYFDRLRRGESDELIFQAHYLLPVDDSNAVQLVFRNVGPRTTVDAAYDNPAARKTLRTLCQRTTLNAPIVPTEGRSGFEILNDGAAIVAGQLALSPLPRHRWLYCLTCEDRTVVRKECVRAFLIRETDLQRFEDWTWCRTQVRVEKPWHWLRVVTLHRIACYHRDECLAIPPQTQGEVPLVDDQRRHHRLITLSLGLIDQETATGQPVVVEWSDKEPELRQRGVELVARSATA